MEAEISFHRLVRWPCAGYYFTYRGREKGREVKPFFHKQKINLSSFNVKAWNEWVDLFFFYVLMLHEHRDHKKPSALHMFNWIDQKKIVTFSLTTNAYTRKFSAKKKKKLTPVPVTLKERKLMFFLLCNLFVVVFPGMIHIKKPQHKARHSSIYNILRKDMMRGIWLITFMIVRGRWRLLAQACNFLLFASTS